MIPEPIPGDRLPSAWLDPNHPQSYRIVVNRPGVAEEAHAPDPVIRLQSVGFEARSEALSEGLDGLRGEAEFKVGGAPHWVQPPQYPRCACGSRMGFVLQVPAQARPGWKFRRGATLPLAAELDVFAFACTAQCNPYAAVLIAQR